MKILTIGPLPCARSCLSSMCSNKASEQWMTWANMLSDHLFSWSTLCTKWHKLHLQEAEAETELGCRMLIRDLTFYRKGKGSRIGPKDKLNCDTDRTVSANPAESSKTTMLFRVLHQVTMTRPLYYHFFQSPETDYLQKVTTFGKKVLCTWAGPKRVDHYKMLAIVPAAG